MADLILWPCSAGKSGKQRSVPSGPKFETFLDEDYARRLLDGRRIELDPCRNPCSISLPAIDLYSGHLYKVNGFREAIRTAIGQGTDCLILSGGYGLIRADEEIQIYEKKIQDARKWKKDSLLASIFGNYLERRRPSRAFIALSRSTYGKVLFGDEIRLKFSLPPSLQLFVYFPDVPIGHSAEQEVPKREGEAVRGLIENKMVPDSRWKRVGG